MSQVQYEVIMTDIAHTMQRDGEIIVFGDVMFGLPNNGRSRISSFGEGPDKQSARQSLIERAVDYLMEEDFNAEDMSQPEIYWWEPTNKYADEAHIGVEYEGKKYAGKIGRQEFDAENESKKSKKKSSKQTAAPVEVVNNRAGFFDDEQDKEYFGFGFIVGGIIVGVLGTIFGNIFSELVLDEMRVKKFGYRDSSQTESSFWELDSD